MTETAKSPSASDERPIFRVVSGTFATGVKLYAPGEEIVWAIPEGWDDKKYGKHFAAYGGVWPPHCVQGTTGAALHPALVLPALTQVVSKGMDPEEDAYSCFQAETGDAMPFAAALGELGVGRLFVGGLATDYCVKSTVVDGVREGFEVVVLADAIAAVDLSPGDGAKALEEMRAAGAQMIRLEELD